MSDHQMHYFRRVRRRDGKRRDPPAVTQDGDGVAKIKDLIKMMGYKDDRYTRGAHVPNNFEEPSDLS